MHSASIAAAVSATRSTIPSRGRSRWLFPNAAGTGPLDPKNWVRRVFKPALKAAGIEDFHFHDKRHTTATRLRSKGTNTDIIAAVLGHADSRLAEAVYAHLVPGALHPVMDLLSRVPTEPTTEGISEGRAENADTAGGAPPGRAQQPRENVG